MSCEMKTIYANLLKKDLEKLDKYCKENNIKRHVLLRNLIKDFLKQIEG